MLVECFVGKTELFAIKPFAKPIKQALVKARACYLQETYKMQANMSNKFNFEHIHMIVKIIAQNTRLVCLPPHLRVKANNWWL